mgnify:CR=1 FL=1
MAKKEILKVIKVHLKGGQASPAPPVGPALSQAGVQVMEFCRQFNDATKTRADETIPTEIIVYKDRSFSFKLKTPLTSELIKKELMIEKGSPEPNRVRVGYLTREQLRKITLIKLPDLNTTDLEKADRIIAGTCRQMGVEVEGFDFKVKAGAQKKKKGGRLVAVTEKTVVTAPANTESESQEGDSDLNPTVEKSTK